MEYRFIEHSGFLVESESAWLLFDYFRGEMPPLPPDKPLFVFSSHVHPDHFNFDVFRLTSAYPAVRYILSNDIHRKFNRAAFLRHGVLPDCYDERITFLSPDSTLSFPPISIETIGSTDQGVAFIITIDGQTVFHAGDLNLWLWEEDTQKEQADMRRRFETELKKLSGRHFDLAFFPLDPRQEGDYPFLGITAFLEATDTKQIVPMHCWGDETIVSRFFSRFFSAEKAWQKEACGKED